MRICRSCLCVAAVATILASSASGEQPLFCSSQTVLNPTWTSHGSVLQPLPPKTCDYTSHYVRHVQNYHRPPTRIRDYIFDKYFLVNPNLSPYLNLTRRNIYGNNYYQRVLPERERRERIEARQRTVVVVVPRQMSVAVAPVHAPLPTPSVTGVSAVESYNNASRYLNKIPATRRFDNPNYLGAAVAGQRH